MTSWSKWTPDRIAEAARLWNGGMPARTIAARMGVSWGALSSITCNYRYLFPARIKPKYTLPTDYLQDNAAPPLNLPSRRTYIDGRWIEHVKRTTQSGAVVTLPRVSFIDGVREGG